VYCCGRVGHNFVDEFEWHPLDQWFSTLKPWQPTKDLCGPPEGCGLPVEKHCFRLHTLLCSLQNRVGEARNI